MTLLRVQQVLILSRFHVSLSTSPLCAIPNYAFALRFLECERKGECLISFRASSRTSVGRRNRARDTLGASTGDFESARARER